jgi:hypothetical protein
VLAGTRPGGFNHVWIDRALREPRHAGELTSLFLEHLDEQSPDGPALLLGIGLAAQRIEESLLGIDANDAHAHVARKRLHHLVALAQAQQPVIDEHAHQLIADGLVQQRRDHGRIDATRETEQHASRTDLLAHACNAFGDDAARIPERLAAADAAHEALEDLAALDRVRDFRVKLHAVEVARLVGHRRDWRIHCACDG